LDYNENNKNYDIKDDTIDYKTGKKYSEYKKEEKKNFKPATFILITGSIDESGEDISEVKQKIIKDVFNNSDNIDGKNIKFCLGSRVMNEGVTLKNCSEVHIIDVFYNLPKVEQVIGRAIRMCVHKDSINDDNPFPKVRVYRYVISKKNELTTDELLYKELCINFPQFISIIDVFINEYKNGVKEIIYVEPTLDYDKYCNYNKTNDKRKSLSLFMVNLMKNDLISKATLFGLITYLQDLVFEYMDELNKINETYLIWLT
jgi:hypothetical protein